MKPVAAFRWLVVLFAWHALAAPAAERITLWTGPEREIQPQFARDIARFVARPAGIHLNTGSAAGPAESLQRMRDASRPAFALLPSDTLPAYSDAAAGGHGEADRLTAPLRVIASLYTEDVYFVARSDAAYDALQDIRDARINVGPLRSSAALSTLTLYRLLFGGPAPEGNLSFLEPEEALVKLITDRTVDVVAFTSPRPARLLVNMKAEARRFVKLLKFDANHAAAPAILQRYDATMLDAAHYPNLLNGDVPALANRIYLVAYALRRSDDELLSRFARAWCRNLPRLHEDGHAKWREIEPVEAALKHGWRYARPVEQEMTRCLGKPLPVPPCPLQERTLGLCE